ncbi:MAG: HAMP domain-containing histidine kinase [Patescibacteria group bacterium]|nr:HAMP domain-containing histidine kinase [Patescibacteria group bacterium]
MKKINFLLIYFLTNIFFLLLFLLIGDFNFLKISILGLLILNFIFIFIQKIIQKEKLISQQEPFYSEWGKLFNFISTPFVIYDEQMKIIYFNKAFSDFVNLEKNTLTNFKIETWIVKNENYLKLALIFFPSLMADSLKIIQSDDPNIIDINYRNEIFLFLITTKIFYQNKLLNIKIIKDYSEEKKQERQAFDLLSLLAHHLRTPLNQLKWLIETNKNSIQPEIFEQSINIINKTLFLTQMVILKSKSEMGKIDLNIELNSIEDLIKQCLDFFKSSLEEKKIKVEIYLDELVKNFYFDKSIMFFILYPIIENGIDYNREGGKLVIDIFKNKDKNYVTLKISDTGIGIEEKDFPHIFKKYFRSEEAKSIKPTGFGLGLSLAYNLTNIHKGEIEFQSKKGEGTTFILNFPLSKDIYGL